MSTCNTDVHRHLLTYVSFTDVGEKQGWVFGPKQDHLCHINLVCPQEQPAMELPKPPYPRGASPVLALNIVITSSPNISRSSVRA